MGDWKILYRAVSCTPQIPAHAKGRSGECIFSRFLFMCPFFSSPKFSCLIQPMPPHHPIFGHLQLVAGIYLPFQHRLLAAALLEMSHLSSSSAHAWHERRYHRFHTDFWLDLDMVPFHCSVGFHTGLLVAVNNDTVSYFVDKRELLFGCSGFADKSWCKLWSVEPSELTEASFTVSHHELRRTGSPCRSVDIS